MISADVLNERSPRLDCETVTVTLGPGAVCRPLIVWAGTRTQTEARLVVAFERFSCRPIAIDTAGTRWRSEHDLPVGAVVTTARGREPGASEIFLVTEVGLQPLSYDAAWDRLDPAGAEDRAAQRAHDAAADEAGLPKILTRFVGAHGLENGVHPAGESHYFAERCTARQAYWRRATRAEVEVALGAVLVSCM